MLWRNSRCGINNALIRGVLIDQRLIAAAQAVLLNVLPAVKHQKRHRKSINDVQGEVSLQRLGSLQRIQTLKQQLRVKIASVENHHREHQQKHQRKSHQIRPCMADCLRLSLCVLYQLRNRQRPQHDGNRQKTQRRITFRSKKRDFAPEQRRLNLRMRINHRVKQRRRKFGQHCENERERNVNQYREPFREGQISFVIAISPAPVSI